MASGLGVRARFTMMYGVALVMTIMLLCGGIYFFIQRALMGQVENHLHKDLATIQEYLKHDRAGLVKVADHGPILLFRVQTGTEPLISSDDWKAEKLEGIVADQGGEQGPYSVQAGTGRPYRVLTGTAMIGSDRYRINVAHSEEAVRQTRKTLAVILLLTLPVAVAVSLAIGYFLAGRVLAPISVITRKAEEITAENLSERLPISDSDDEFNRLATVFNQAFARIEDSFYRLKRFTADASHEMRTPLAAIRSIGETALHASNNQGDCREAIGSILEENDRLRQMIDSLLVLSRADSNQVELIRETVDLGELVRESVDLLNILAEEKHQSIRLAADLPVIVTVDRAMVRQALINLLDNAIKYSPPESHITLTVGRTNSDDAYVSIADNGIGIPEPDLQRIFDRFYRVDKGRSRETGGAGLGLAIAKWAVECNNGRIEAHSTANEGSEFRIIFQQQA
ncbi:MAG TPA: HAMP domain-containing protein [Desulfuromonadales bacterium]|nr:HAMP domain-containing protein [Desulfuromonadales bacterium]